MIALMLWNACNLGQISAIGPRWLLDGCNPAKRRVGAANQCSGDLQGTLHNKFISNM